MRKTKGYFGLGIRNRLDLLQSFHALSSEIKALFYLQSLQWLLFRESPVLGNQKKNQLDEKYDRFLNL